MDEHFYLYNENNKKVEEVSAEEYKQNHDVRLANAQSEADRKKANMDYFTGIRSKTNAVLPHYLEMEAEAGQTYSNKLTDAERAKKRKTSGTEIKTKHENAARIEKAQQKLKTDMDKRSAAVAKGLRVSKEDVSAIASFYGSSKTENLRLARSWMNRERQPKEMFFNIFNAFLQNSFDDLDLSTEKNLSQNAERMERISAQYDVVLNMLSEYRDLYDELPEKSRKLVNKKIGEANGIINYYRLMRTVITNPYYMDHENRELGLKKSDHDSLQQKQLIRQLWLAKGGLKVLTDYGVKELNDRLDALCSKLSTTVFTEEQLKIQKELSERQDEIEKNGLSGHLNKMSEKGKLDGLRDNGSNKSIIFRARNSVKELNLPERVEDAVKSVSGILDQLDFLEAFSKEKINSRNSYLMEHNYRDIAVMEKVESLSGPLKEMKEAILSVIRVSDKGLLSSAKVSGAALKEAQKKYADACEAYREGMRQVGLLNTGFLIPPPGQEMMDLLASADKVRKTTKEPKEKASEEQKAATREKIREMMLKLAGAGYSDAAIYENAKEIMELMKEKHEVFGLSSEFFNLNHLCFLAEYLYATKRRQDIAEAKEQQDLSPELKNALEAEDEKLKSYVQDKNGDPLPSLGTARGVQKNIRMQAEKDSHDLEDLKATAAHYLFQEEWAKNSKRAQTPFKKKVSRSIFSGLTRFLGWVFSKSKTTDHGRVLYEDSRQKLTQLPQEIETFGNDGANHTIRHGDGTYAPPVELNKYFKDPMKMTIATGCNDIIRSMDGNAAYPQFVTDAVDALSSYCRVRGIVNRDTFEMEQAFLDKFRVCMDEMISGISGNGGFFNEHPVLSQKLLKTYKDMLSLSNGNLRNKMTKEEYEVAKDQKAIYVRDTYVGDMKESNMRDLPLFPHSPTLNDVKQGTVGDCYLAAATQTILAENPEAIRDMFCDLGNGEVLVRLYAAFGDVVNPDGSKEYRRIDDQNEMRRYTLRPVYVKVKKQYTTGEAHSSDCMWMQLLEVAYAAAAFTHGDSEIKEDGELIDLNKELTDGEAQAAMMHLTGQKYAVTVPTKTMVHTLEQSEIDKSTAGIFLQKHIMLAGVDVHMRDPILKELKAARKNALKNGANIDADWETNAIRTAVLEGIQAASKTRMKWREDLDALEKQGRLTKLEKNGLIKKIEERYACNEEDRKKLAESFTTRILANIRKPGKAPTRAPKGYLPLSFLASDIHLLKENGRKESAYESILESLDKTMEMKGGAPTEPVTEGASKAIRFSVKNYMTPNPDNRYTQKELGILNLVRGQVKKGRAVCFAGMSHVRTALDVKLHNGKWFILVRDPFNVYRNEYTMQGNNLQTKSYGLSSTLFAHFTARKLSPDLKTGFLGTCWYELKDIAKDMLELSLPYEDDEMFVNGFDWQ